MDGKWPFWKWRRWKSISYCLWPPTTFIWNLKLKFQSKLNLCSGNHAVYRQTDGRTDKVNSLNPPPSNFVGRGYKYTTNGSSVYLDCFISLPFSRSTSSAHTYMPRLLHSSDCSTVPTFCTDNHLGSRVYFGIYRFSCFLLPTEFIEMTMSACCPSHFWIFCAFADNLMIMGLYRPDKLLVAVCPGPPISWPLIGRSFSAHWDKLMASPPACIY